MSVDTWLELDLPRLLPVFLHRQRWFAGKARQISDVSVEDAVWLTASPRHLAFVVAAVRYADGPHERYGMLVGVTGQHVQPPVATAIGRLGPTAWAFDASAETDGARALLAGFADRRAISMLHGGTLLYGDTPTPADARVARIVQRGVVEPIGTEQSNTALRLVAAGSTEARDALVFKLFRKLETGENPDVEVGRFLTHRTAFRSAPALRGSLTYVSATGDSSTAGILQDWIDSLSDGWTHVVALLRQAGNARGSTDTLTRDVSSLGTVTADLHAALAAGAADAAFAPEPVTAADTRAWHASLVNRAERTAALLERQIPSMNGEARRLTETLLAAHQPTLAAAVPALADADGFTKIRVHGDYHLGQVLKTRDGFVVIDFEGEPARPLADRRRKCSALKDAAGMIRSFAYAHEAARADGRHTAEEEVAQHLRQSFVDAYLTSAAARDTSFIPRRRETIDAWIDFFEFEKALYEVEYEVHHRPGWAHIPLRGVLRILRRPT